MPAEITLKQQISDPRCADVTVSHRSCDQPRDTKRTESVSLFYLKVLRCQTEFVICVEGNEWVAGLLPVRQRLLIGAVPAGRNLGSC